MMSLRLTKNTAQFGPNFGVNLRPNIVEEIGCLWVEKKPIRDHVDRTFYELVVKASVQIVKALNDFEDQNTYPSGANFNYLDTLARIAKACIVAEQWPRAEFVLSQMNELVTDSRETPAYAAVCLSQVLPTAVQSLPLQAVVLWIAAVNQFLDHNASAVSESGLGRLLNQARNANHNEEIVSSSELRTSLDDLIQRLTKKQI